MLWKTINNYEGFTLEACPDAQALAKTAPNKDQPGHYLLHAVLGWFYHDTLFPNHLLYAQKLLL